jgi:outer membrane protein OmpA-like peptidoglycan-associated protein
MNEQEVKAVFGDALAARPDPPLSFTLYFREGTNELTPESKQLLADITREISRRGSKISEVTVVGHTDRVGKLEFNDRLSLQRSRFVVDELVSIGVDRQAITASGRGEREPVVITEDEVPEARNRRVEVSVR